MENSEAQLPPKVESVRGKETQLPKITYEFFFAPHGSPTDLKGLQERFDNADIYIPEVFGWTQANLEFIRGVASGETEIVPNKPMGAYTSLERWHFALMQMIYNSQKPITLIDIPEASKGENAKIKSDWDWTGDFSDMLSSVKRESENMLNFQKRREQHMFDNLEAKISELLEEYPSLKDKGELRVLLSLGSAHDPIYIDLKKTGVDTIRFFGHPLYIFNFAHEGARRLRFNRLIDDELAAKIFLEGMFSGTLADDLDKLTEDTNKKMNVVRKFVNQFNFREARGIFKTIIKYPNQDIKLLMEFELKKKGIRMPESEKELDEFLAQPLARPKPSQESKWRFWKSKK